MRSSALSAAGCLLILVTVPGNALAQCPNAPVDGNLTTIDGSLLAGGTCTVPGPNNIPVAAADNWLTNGGWLKAGTRLDAHTRAETSGKCLWGTMSFTPTFHCDLTDHNDLRTVNHVVIRLQPHQFIDPAHDPLPTDFTVWAVNDQGYTTFRQLVDTQASGTTGPLVTYPGYYTGRYDYSFSSIVNTTNCNIGPNQSAVITRSVNVVACAPNFSYNGKHIPNDSQTIHLYVTDGAGSKMDQAADAAIAGWSNAGLPISFDKVYTPCADVYDIHCIQIWSPNGGVPGNAPTCAAASSPPLAPDGLITQRIEIYLRGDYNGWDQAYLNEVVEHELAHAMGINHQQTRCVSTSGAGLSIMNVNSDQLGCNHMDGLASTPQVSDALAIMKSVCDNTPKKSCQQ